MNEREAIKEESQKRRRQNYIKSKTILNERSIQYIEKTNWHFIIWDFDIWLTTWLFIHRKTKKRGRWIFNLLKKIKCDIK